MQSTALSDDGLPAPLLLERIAQCSSSSGNESGGRITISDESQGLYGDWYPAEQVMDMLTTQATRKEGENVGTPVASSDGQLASQNYSLTSFLSLSSKEVVTPHEIPMEIHNFTSTGQIRIRWLDEHGKFYPRKYQWNVDPSSSFDQYTKPGHLFLISLLPHNPKRRDQNREEPPSFDEDDDDDDDEDSHNEHVASTPPRNPEIKKRKWLQPLLSEGETDEDEDFEILLAAYRPKRSLPSLAAHCLYISADSEDGDANCSSNICLGMFFLDETQLDAMAVAAWDMDCRHETTIDRTTMNKTVKFLQTIIGNLLKDPDETKFQSLRLNNPKIQVLVQEWGAGQFLKLIGFEQEQKEGQEYLVLSKLPVRLSLCQQCLDVLDILVHRLGPSFVRELAPPTPWQPASGIVAAGSHAGSTRGTNRGGFLSEDERWARIERVTRQRRSGAARRPAPGQAPSSKGKWGR